jgi:hypothetical protein
VNTDFVTGARDGDRHAFNYFIMKAIYDRVEKRSGRGYDLQKSYSQDMDYPGAASGIKRFYFNKTTGKWVFPGGTGETMCVAAVAEIIVEALNVYVEESNDTSVAQKLPAEHWSASAKTKHIRPHIWEYSGLGSKGSGHAMERFDIGVQKKLAPGDMLKINRNSAPGHSTIFIAYLDQAGKTLEAYSSKAKGFLYFSAHGGGFSLNGAVSTGLSFKREYFAGHCPAGESASRCKVIGPGGTWGPNLGRMFHPKSWGEDVGKSYRDELLKKLYVEKTGSKLQGDPGIVLNSSSGGGLESELNDILEREMDPSYVGYFDEGQ